MQYENFQHIILLACCSTVWFWQLLIVEDGEEAEKKNSSQQRKSSHPVTWKLGVKGFQNGFAVSKPHIVFGQESNFAFSYIVLFFFHPYFPKKMQYHPAFLLHVRESSVC